jgi:5-formyltetrahydrofolate cyclo-ligase
VTVPLPDTKSVKQEIRRRVLAAREALPPDLVAVVSRRILAHIEAAGLLERGVVFHLYYPMRGEVDVRPLIERLWARGATVLLPRSDFASRRVVNYPVTSFADLEPTRFGLHEPKRGGTPWTGAVDVVFVPGVAFDRRKNRLGYGAGFYDRFLAEAGALKVAPAFELQLVPEIPADAHDIAMDLLATETGVF